MSILKFYFILDTCVDCYSNLASETCKTKKTEKIKIAVV